MVLLPAPTFDGAANSHVAAMSASPALSVVVPCFNEEGNLTELASRVASLVQRRKIEGELILVDDASRDATPEVIRGLAKEHPWVRPIAHESNRGIAEAWRTL